MLVNLASPHCSPGYVFSLFAEIGTKVDDNPIDGYSEQEIQNDNPGDHAFNFQHPSSGARCTFCRFKSRFSAIIYANNWIIPRWGNLPLEP